MTDKSTPIESIPVDNKDHLIDPLIEPAVNIDTSVESPPTILQRFSGILYALLAAFLFTTPVFVTKQLQVELLDALVPRFLVQTIILFVYMKFIKHYSLYKQAEKREIIFLIINMLSSTTGFLAFFIAYRYLPLSDLTTIRYTQVIWTAIITAILYCEKPSIPIILATLLTTTGVICVAQPNFLFEKTSNITTSKISTDDSHQRLIGLSIALYASIAMTIMVISNRYLLIKCKTKHSLVVLQFAFISLCVLVLHLLYKYYFLTDRIQSLKRDFFHWRYLCAASICLLQIISSVFTQKAIKREHPSIFTIVQSSDILFSILLQSIFSSMKSNYLSLFGSILVLISIVIISGFKFIHDQRQQKKNTVPVQPKI